MTRMTARQIAVQILFSMESNASTAEDAMALFFSEEHYASLKEEDEIYRDAPDEEQTAYIRGNSAGFPNRPLRFCAAQSAKSSIWMTSRIPRR